MIAGVVSYERYVKKIVNRTQWMATCTFSHNYVAQVSPGKIARFDWFLTWRDFSVLVTAGITQIVNAL